MSNATPKAWRCTLCNERVDPTMDLCWSCGADRDGQYDKTWYRRVGPGAMESCPQCDYSLVGSTDTQQCPECGYVLPEAGFRSEVVAINVDRRMMRCRRCRYDLRGTPDASNCPECGYALRFESYETVQGDHEDEQWQAAIQQLRKHQQRYAIGFVAMAFPGCVALSLGAQFMDASLDMKYAEAMLLLWFIFTLVLAGLTVWSWSKKPGDFIDRS